MIWVRGQIVADDALTDQRAGPDVRARPGPVRDLPDLERPPDAPAPAPGPADPLGRASWPAARPGQPARRRGRPRPAHGRRAATATPMLRITLSGGISAPSHGSTLWMRSFPCRRRLRRTGSTLGPAWPVADRPAGRPQDAELLAQPADVRGRPARGLRRVPDDLAGRPALGREPVQPLRGRRRPAPDAALRRQGLARDHAGADPGACGRGWAWTSGRRPWASSIGSFRPRRSS